MSRHLQVSKFELFETGSYNDQLRRPISTSMTSDHIARIQEATNYGSNLSTTALASVASEILMPCTEFEQGRILIPGGWKTKRYYFILEITTGVVGKSAHRKVLTGYTDIADISHRGSLPPEMCLHINGHLTLRDVQVPGPTGIQYQTNIIGNDQIIVGDYRRMSAGNNEHSLRPYDVMRRLGTSMMESEDDGVIDFDLTSSFSAGVKNNERKNGNAGNYLSKMLMACRDSDSLQSNQYLDPLAAKFDSAAGILKETPLSDDVVFHKFNRMTEFARTGFITLADLESMAPGTEANARVHRFGGVHAVRGPSQQMDSQHWYGDNIETKIATRIANAIPGIMLDNAMNRMSFAITNMNPNNEVVIIPADHVFGSIIQGIDLVRQAEMVMMRVRHELVPGLTMNNVLGVYIQVTCDTFSETRIDVSIDGAPPTPFVSATFADSLFAPIITANIDNVHRLVSDIGNLSANLGPSSAVSPRTYGGFNAGSAAPAGAFGSRFR